MNKSILNKLLACLPRRSTANTGLLSSVSCLLSSVLCLLPFAGCAENKYAKTIDQICPPAINRTVVMTTAEWVITDMQFDIEKFDVDAGYIRTAPLSGSQSFELWRSDSVGSFNQSEADLHSIRRTVEINISEQPGQMCVNCIATTQRLSMPQDLAAADQSRPIMSPGQRSLQKPKPGSEHKVTISWTDLGRDNQLETEILKRIERQLGATKKEPNK